MKVSLCRAQSTQITQLIMPHRDTGLDPRLLRQHGPHGRTPQCYLRRCVMELSSSVWPLAASLGLHSTHAALKCQAPLGPHVGGGDTVGLCMESPYHFQGGTLRHLCPPWWLCLLCHLSDTLGLPPLVATWGAEVF